jgi:hypothetical protein
MKKFGKGTRTPYFIGIGVLTIVLIYLIYLSSQNGSGGKSLLSYCLDPLIHPFPFILVLSIIILIIRAFKKPETNDQ